MFINIKENKPQPKDALEQYIDTITRLSNDPKTGRKVFQEKTFVKVGDTITQEQWDNIFGKK